MPAPISISRLFTDNPFIDSLLYYVKYLACNSVVKLEFEADRYETASSANNGDTYIAAYEGRAIFESFKYIESDYNSIGIMDKEEIRGYMKDQDSVPLKYRDLLLKVGKKRFMDEYDEQNNYYRMICGLPDVGDTGIPIKHYEYLIPEGNEWDGVYIHEMGPDGCAMLERYGILDIIRQDYPNAKYLNYITAGVSIYKARKAYNFQILYHPSIDNTDVEEKFEEKYNLNRAFVVQTMYDQAMEFRSEYYPHFMGMLIMLMTMVDMISEVQDHIIQKNILDARCIAYIFEQFGVPYFRKIPLVYQIRLVKRIHDIVRNKSSAQDMKNFLEIFGAEEVNIYKYYLIRDRVQTGVDSWVYKQITKMVTVNNEDLTMDEVEVIGPHTTVPLPFETILSKGNTVLVFKNGIKLDQNTDYRIYNNDSISFTTPLTSTDVIKYIFVYDINSSDEDFVGDKDNGVHIYTEQITTDSNVIPFNPPYSEYFTDGNQVMVLVDGAPLNQTMYKVNDDNIEISESFGINKLHKCEVVLIYIYSTKYSTKYQRMNVTATEDDQTVFIIPEPFPNYVDQGCHFFITYANTFISDNRYTYTSDHVTFTDIKVPKGSNVSFHFVYTTSSMFTPVNIMHKIVNLTATQEYQMEFPIELPIKNYLKMGYRLYIKLRGWFLSDDYYDVFSDKIQFRDLALALHPGDVLEVHMIYGPEAENVYILHDSVESKFNYQDTFDIYYPHENFFENGGKLFVDSAGWVMEEGVDYHLTDDRSQVVIDNLDIRPFKGQRVNYTFMYNGVSKNKIVMQTDVYVATKDGTNTVPMNYPFYPYFPTGQSVILMHRTGIIPPDQWKINPNDKYSLLVDDNIVTGDKIFIIYIYNSRYASGFGDLVQVEMVRKAVSLGPNPFSNPIYTQDIPLPSDDYLEHGWPMLIMADDKLLDDSQFEVVNNSFNMMTPTDISNYSYLTYIFAYKNYEPYAVTKLVEDFDSNISLHFTRIPLFDDHPQKYLTDKSAYKGYDAVTLADRFWDGADNADAYHDELKAIIKQRPWNYSRTKYMDLMSVVDVSEFSFLTSYLLGLLFDDYFLENKLTIVLPNISENKKFLLSHVFVFLTAASHLYTGYTDSLIDSPSKALWVLTKRFNMGADLDKLKQDLMDQYEYPSDYIPTWEFIIPKEPINSFGTLLNQYRTNKNIYKHIIHNMASAPDLRSYKCWKALYDSLMLVKNNNDYFRLADGEIAPTYSEFLREKEILLYETLEELKTIEDPESRENAIINMMNDVVYVLEGFLANPPKPEADSPRISFTFTAVVQKFVTVDVPFTFTILPPPWPRIDIGFKVTITPGLDPGSSFTTQAGKGLTKTEIASLWRNIPGVGADYLITYIKILIEFFKSYKVSLNNAGTELVIGSDPDDPDARVHVVDDMELNVNLDFPEYASVREEISPTVNLEYSDRIQIREALKLDYEYED